MIQLYSLTPNGHKVSVALEERTVVYATYDQDVGEQFAPQFIEMNPNAKIPVIIDEDVPILTDYHG